MELVRTKSNLQLCLSNETFPRPVGLVPTMGNLHEGHLELVRVASERCGFVIVTIFVNPMQFGPNEDFVSYPRMLEKDAELLNKVGTDVLFAPSLDEMYPSGRDSQTKVSVPSLTDVLCGKSRPEHFDGVTTVVSKLFHLTKPQIAFFGEKDWQQLTVIKRMVSDLDFPLRIIGVPTQRADDGLALSSRNGYLNAMERKLAPKLNRTLQDLREEVVSGNDDYEKLQQEAMERLSDLGFRPEYVEVRDADDLQVPGERTSNRRAFAAAYVGKARLIDNIPIDS